MLFAIHPMHIPDGFLSLPVAVVCWVLAAFVLAAALRNVNRSLGERLVPMMGVLAAAIFAGQMLNFAVLGGTSGHLLGAALAAILLGPWPAVVVMSAVAAVQALVFQDGGLLALGANILNMAVIGVFVTAAVDRIVRRLLAGRRGLLVSGFLAAWVSLMAAALATGLQLAVSGASPARLVIPVMAAVHALIGVGEGLITLGALAFLFSARPQLFQPHPQQRSGFVWLSGLVAAALLAVLSPLASSNPDGLEVVAGSLGFLDRASAAPFQIAPDYTIPGIADPVLSTVLAGLAGVLVAAGLIAVLVGVLHKNKATR